VEGTSKRGNWWFGLWAKGAQAQGGTTYSTSLQKRPLILPHEVREMRRDEQILFAAAKPALRCGRAIFFRRPEMLEGLGKSKLREGSGSKSPAPIDARTATRRCTPPLTGSPRRRRSKASTMALRLPVLKASTSRTHQSWLQPKTEPMARSAHRLWPPPRRTKPVRSSERRPINGSVWNRSTRPQRTLPLFHRARRLPTPWQVPMLSSPVARSGAADPSSTRAASSPPDKRTAMPTNKTPPEQAEPNTAACPDEHGIVLAEAVKDDSEYYEDPPLAAS
jgi:Type IV secretory system Conjugative DNA transfer